MRSEGSQARHSLIQADGGAGMPTFSKPSVDWETGPTMTGNGTGMCEMGSWGFDLAVGGRMTRFGEPTKRAGTDEGGMIEIKHKRTKVLLHRLDVDTLEKADLRGLDLSGADLSNANLAGADLSGTCLNQARLKGANFQNANLQGTEMVDATLYEIDFRGANLQNADLSFSGVSGADFRGANLTGTRLERTIYDLTTRWPTGFKPHQSGAERLV